MRPLGQRRNARSVKRVERPNHLVVAGWGIGRSEYEVSFIWTIPRISAAEGSDLRQWIVGTPQVCVESARSSIQSARRECRPLWAQRHEEATCHCPP